MTTEVSDKFCYVCSCDLDVNIQIKIGTLEGKRDRPSYKELLDDPLQRYSGAYEESCSDLYVECQIVAEGRALALPHRTSYKAFSTRWNWNEWLTLPVKYSDLPRNAELILSVYDIYGCNKDKIVGESRLTLFGKSGIFRQGMLDLKVATGDDKGSLNKVESEDENDDDEMNRLAKLTKKHRNGHMAKVDWLDRLTFREIELINEKQKRESNCLYLMIEFPNVHFNGVQYAVVYFEKGGDEILPMKTLAEIVKVPDTEIMLENLVESKHHKLARSLRSRPTDKDMKPNATTRDLLNRIVEYPPTKMLTSEEKDLIWKFRFYLSNQKKALTKFLKSVSWTVSQEAKQALELLNGWIPMDADDALELLSPTFTHPAVRKYAIARLQQSHDEELLLYLLQLVQALKYEDVGEIQMAYEAQKNAEASSAMAEAALAEACEVSTPQQAAPQTPPLIPLPVDQDNDADRRSLASDTPPAGEVNTESLLDALGIQRDTSRSTSPSSVADRKAGMDLATFLITRACNNTTLTNYFYWYLHVECGIYNENENNDANTKKSKTRDMYTKVLYRFSQALKNAGPEYKSRRAAIADQKRFMDRIVILVKQVARESGNRRKKIEKLQSLLADFVHFEQLPLPLDPHVIVKGIIPEEATLFPSALMPCRFTFQTVDDLEYITIFKHGDDLRQDQLVLQIITLMDKLLMKENLDLKLTPYKVLATSSKHGFVQFIRSIAVADVLAKNEGSILNYFRKIAPSESSPLGVLPEVMDNYVKSCAGYCVITYILGVGDRHLDNLLLSDTGKLFHIDFGYMLGRDPKPKPPPMKLSKEMVEAMGGTSSEQFTSFRKLTYTAYLHLRRSSNLILNLFSLMVDANIPDIALEPDKAVKKVQDRFNLEMTDEEAVQDIQRLIDVSAAATMDALMEQVHKWAQNWRK